MSKKSSILVILQILAMIFLVVANNPIAGSFGIIIQLLGCLIGIWGVLTIGVSNFNIQPEVKSETLIQSGPYKWIRNPMYTAVILFYLPIIIQNYNLVNVLVSILLLIALILKILSEEQFLTEQFGDEYLKYKSKTKRLLPFLF